MQCNKWIDLPYFFGVDEMLKNIQSAFYCTVPNTVFVTLHNAWCLTYRFHISLSLVRVLCCFSGNKFSRRLLIYELVLIGRF